MLSTTRSLPLALCVSGLLLSPWLPTNSSSYLFAQESGPIPDANAGSGAAMAPAVMPEEPPTRVFPALPADPQASPKPLATSHGEALTSVAPGLAKLPNSKPKVAVLDSLCSVDGVDRVDLARLLSDQLSATLLKQGGCEVLDATLVQASAVHSGPAAPLSGSVSQVGLGLGVDFVVLPSCIAQGKSGQLSLKVVAVATSKVQNILQAALPQGAESIQPEVAKLAAQLFPAPQVAVRAPRYDRMREELAKEMLAKQGQAIILSKAIETAPKATKVLTASDLAAAQEARPLLSLGQITRLLPQWSCCEITCPTGVGTVKVGDMITVYVTQTPRTAFELKVARVAGQTVIADLPASATQAASISPGQPTYYWGAE